MAVRCRYGVTFHPERSMKLHNVQRESHSTLTVSTAILQAYGYVDLEHQEEI